MRARLQPSWLCACATFLVWFAILPLVQASRSRGWGLESHGGFKKSQFRAMECCVFLSTYGLCKVWTHCSWWSMKPYLIAAILGCRKFGWMICGWILSSGAKVAVRLGFMAKRGHEPEGYFDKVYIAAIIGAGAKWLPFIPQQSYYMKAGSAVFVALGLYFPFPHSRCCCWKRGVLALTIAGFCPAAVWVMLSAKVWLALPWLKNANVLKLDARALGETKKEPRDWNDNWVLMTLADWSGGGPPLVTVPAQSDSVKCNKRLIKFVCFLYAVSELGYHVSVDVAHGNPYLTGYAFASAFAQLSVDAGGDLRGAACWLHPDMKKEGLMKPSVQGGTLLPWKLPHANLFDSGENNWGYTDAMAEQQLREQLAFSTFSSYQVFLLIYNFGVLVAGPAGNVLRRFFSGKDGDGSKGVSSISDKKGRWSKKLKEFVVEAPWRRLAETWKLRNEPRVVELSDDQYVQCLAKAEELYTKWFVNGLGRARSMVCHEKFQMDEYLVDGMRKSGYLAIEWGNLGENDDAPLDWREVFAAAAKEADEDRKALDEAAAEPDAAEAEASAEAEEDPVAAARATLDKAYKVRAALVNTAMVTGARPAEYESLLESLNAIIESRLQDIAKKRDGGHVSTAIDVEAEA